MLAGLWKRETGEQLVFRSLLLQINFQFMVLELELPMIRVSVIHYFYPTSPFLALLFVFSIGCTPPFHTLIKVPWDVQNISNGIQIL